MATLEFLGFLEFWKNRINLGIGQQIDTDTDTDTDGESRIMRGIKSRGYTNLVKTEEYGLQVVHTYTDENWHCMVVNQHTNIH